MSLKRSVVTLSTLLLGVLPTVAHAQLNAFSPDEGYIPPIDVSSFDAASLATTLIRCVLGFIGFFLLIQLVYGAIHWATWEENLDQREEAWDILKTNGWGMAALVVAVFLVGPVVNWVSSLAQNYL